MFFVLGGGVGGGMNTRLANVGNFANYNSSQHSSSSSSSMDPFRIVYGNSLSFGGSYASSSGRSMRCFVLAP